jgi:hypothetical protein
MVKRFQHLEAMGEVCSGDSCYSARPGKTRRCRPETKPWPPPRCPKGLLPVPATWEDRDLLSPKFLINGLGEGDPLPQICFHFSPWDLRRAISTAINWSILASPFFILFNASLSVFPFGDGKETALRIAQQRASSPKAFLPSPIW